MEEKILTLAETAAGAPEGEALLAALCTAAVQWWSGRLREGVTPEECGEAFLCAAAFTAAADWLGAREGVAFTAGEVSLRRESGAGEALRRTAERLMAPWARTADVCFRRV